MTYRCITNVKLHSCSSECVGPLNPEVVQSTELHSNYQSSNVLILGEDGQPGNDKSNFWLAERAKTTGQGFTMKVDDCARMIAGCQIKNLGGKGFTTTWATKDFRVWGAINENSPWETLVEDQLVYAVGKAASLRNFTFEEPVEIQFLKFELVTSGQLLGN